MTKNMYQLSKKKYGKCPYDNETLAVMIRSGDESAVRWLLSQEEGFLESIVYKICSENQAEVYGDDLKQIGALALEEAAKRFDPDRGVKLTTYAYTAVRDKMLSMFYELSAPASMPPGKMHQLRVVSFLRSSQEYAGEAELLIDIQKRLNVSEAAAHKLLALEHELSRSTQLGDQADRIVGGTDPAKIYDRNYAVRTAMQLMKEVLRSRERLLVEYHLDFTRPAEREYDLNYNGMTFTELAIRLNYNDASAAEKAYRRAVKKLQEHMENSEYAVWRRAKKAVDKVIREGSPETKY